MEILGLTESNIAADGKHLKLQFETEGQPLSLDVNVSLLEGLLSQLAATIAKGREIGGGNYAPVFAQPDALLVKASLSRQAITTSFRMSNGLHHNLIFAPPDAKHLQTRLGEELDRLSGS